MSYAILHDAFNTFLKILSSVHLFKTACLLESQEYKYVSRRFKINKMTKHLRNQFYSLCLWSWRELFSSFLQYFISSILHIVVYLIMEEMSTNTWVFCKAQCRREFLLKLKFLHVFFLFVCLFDLTQKDE